MNKIERKLAVVVLATLVFAQQIVMAQTYGGAYNETGILPRTSWIGQQTLDSDLRIQGLGQLSLPIDDESNAIGVFKYGEISAGLADDYRRGKAELSYQYEDGTIERGNLIGSSAGDYKNTKHNNVHALGVLPIPTPNGNGAVAVRGALAKFKGEFTSRGLSDEGFRSAEDEPAISSLFAGYGQRYGGFLFGISIESDDAELVKTPFVESSAGEADTNLQDLERLDIQPSLGYAFDLDDTQRLTIAAGPRFRSEELKVGLLNYRNDMDEDGVLLDAGVHYNKGQAIKSGLFLHTGKHDGDAEVTQFDDPVLGTIKATGNSETKISDVSWRGYVKPENLPFSFGAEISKEVEKDTEVIAGTRSADEETRTTTLGIGVAGHFPNDKGLVGVQYENISGKFEDSLDSANTEDRDGYAVSVGGEYNLTKMFAARAGYRMRTAGEDPSGAAGVLDTDTRDINLGLDFRFSEAGTLALLLTNTKIKSDSITYPIPSGTATLPEREYTANSVQLLARYRFGAEADEQ